MERIIVATPRAPRAIGPYSQAVVVDGGRLVFCSGQIPLHPGSGALVGEGDVAAQTRQVMDNLRAVLEAAGSALDRVVRTTIFLADLGDFAAVNEVYGSYFAADPPARATVQVAALPRGARVEIDAIAVADALEGVRSGSG
jgi:2-iminobutanoate/2-iminopropanoate deaminase